MDDQTDHRSLSLANRRFFAGPAALFSMGIMALTPVLVFLKRLIEAALPGGPFLSSVVTVPTLLFMGLFIWIALIGFSPRLHQRFLRRRQIWPVRILIGLGLTIAFFLVFVWGSIAAVALGEAEIIRTAILIASVPIYLLLAFAFFLPGAYAAALTARHERDTAGPNAGVSDERDPTAIGSYTGPRGQDDARWGDGSENMARVKEDWRARVMSRHGMPGDTDRGRYARRPSAKKTGGTSTLSLVVRSIVGVVLLICAAGTVHAQIVGWFLPTTEVEALSREITVPAMIVAAILGVLLSLYGAPSQYVGPLKSLLVRLPLLVGALVLLAWFFAQVTVAQGLPALHNRIAGGEPITVRAVVDRVGPSQVRRGCDTVIYLRGTGEYAARDIKLCEVPTDLWERLSAGQVVRVSGPRSRFGLRIETLRPEG